MLESVKKTGRIIIAGDATSRGSFLNDLARNVTELAFDELDAPPVVLGSRDWITPAYELEITLSSRRWTSFIDAIHEKIVPLKGHVPTRNYRCRSKSAALKRAFNRTRPISNQAMNHVRILSIQFQA
ncbi:MAG: transketolase C-terminal domain-containing protein [Alistipes indistinctus]